MNYNSFEEYIESFSKLNEVNDLLYIKESTESLTNRISFRISELQEMMGRNMFSQMLFSSYYLMKDLFKLCKITNKDVK